MSEPTKIRIEYINMALNQMFNENYNDWLDGLDTYESYPEERIKIAIREEFAGNSPEMLDDLIHHALSIAKQLQGS